jgi:hypothetical protein
MNLEKCDFNTNTVEFLGFIISPDKVAMEASQVAAIKD